MLDLETADWQRRLTNFRKDRINFPPEISKLITL